MGLAHAMGLAIFYVCCFSVYISVLIWLKKIPHLPDIVSITWCLIASTLSHILTLDITTAYMDPSDILVGDWHHPVGPWHLYGDAQGFQA
jgi:hypothetical protein